MPKVNKPKVSTKQVRNTVAAKVSTASAIRQISDQDVAQRAYAIWESEGRLHGRHEEHWLRARADLGA